MRKILLNAIICFISFTVFGQASWNSTTGSKYSWPYVMDGSTSTETVGTEFPDATETPNFSISTVQTSGFLPQPLSGIAKAHAPKTRGGKYTIIENGADDKIKMVGGRLGAAAKFSLYDIDEATALTTTNVTLNFENNFSSNNDWVLVIGYHEPSGAANIFNDGYAVQNGARAEIYASLKFRVSGTDVNKMQVYYSGVNDQSEQAYVPLGDLIDRGSDHKFEVLCNNTNASQTYARGGATYTVPSTSFHVWVDGARLSIDLGGYDFPGGSLAAETVLNSMMITGNNNNNPDDEGFVTISDISMQFAPVAFTPDNSVEFSTLYQRLFDDYLSTSFLQSQATIQGLMDAQQSDGSWLDIDYSSTLRATPWPPMSHWDNLLFMAVAYSAPSHHFYHDATLKDKIKSGILYWYNRSPQPESLGWFYNDIGKQQRIYKILILMKNQYAEPDLTDVIYNVCDRYLVLPSDFYTNSSRGTLTNAVWMAANLVNNGVIKRDIDKLQLGIQIMSDQLLVRPLGELGTQSDYSFQVHGPTIYNGGYGASLIEEISYYMYQSRGLTVIGFSQANIDVLSDCILKGDQWMVLGKTYDFNVVGRGISRLNKTNTERLKPVLDQMIYTNPSKASEFQTMLDNINDETGSTESIIGNKHFYRADYMTHRRKNLLIGVRMNSTRISSTESINTENKKANWLGLGTTSIMRTGDDYYNIYPVWDWAKIPGVTNPDVEIIWTEDEKDNRQSLPTAGGVSDGSNGVIGMSIDKISKNGSINIDIKAKKANFLWDNEMVCLGVNIQSNYADAPVISTINQTFLKSFPVVDGTALTSFGEDTYPGMGWVYCDDIGYVIRDNATVKLKEDTQSGRWKDIIGGGSSSTVSARVFKLWIDHGTQPTNASYDYAVLPNYTQQQTSDYASNPTSVTLANNATVQAVTQTVLQQTGAVFYTSGELVINPNLKLEVDKPSVLLIDWKTVPIKVTVSDINQNQTSLNVTLTYGDASSEVLSYNLPQGNTRGSSVSLNTVNAPILSVPETSGELSIFSNYPNPTSDKLNISGVTAGEVIKLLDLNGREIKVQVQKLNSGSAILNLQSLSAGTYILLVESQGKVIYNRKIIKR